MRSIKWCHFQWSWTNPNPVFKVTPLFDAKYLSNGYRYGHSYYRRRIGNRTQAFEWHQFQWPWVTSNSISRSRYYSTSNVHNILRVDLIWCYKILFGLISIDSADLFEVRQATATRGHPYKLFKEQCTINARSSFFTQRIINVWNDLPVNTTNFSLNCFRYALNKVDLSSYLGTWSLANTPIVVFITVIFSSIVFSCSVLCKFCVSFFLLKGSSKCGFSTLLSCSCFIICSLFASCIFIWTNKDDDDDDEMTRKRYKIEL